MIAMLTPIAKKARSLSGFGISRLVGDGFECSPPKNFLLSLLGMYSF